MKDRTKALAIPQAVKKAVAKRDSAEGWPCCIYCGQPAPTGNPLAFSNAHYIARSQGGLGIEKNILTLCPDCHRLYDATEHRERLRHLFRTYLEAHYTGWIEGDLIFKKEAER